MTSTSVEDYLARVRRSLLGMDRSVREDIVRELGANLTESVSSNGGNVGAAIAAIGSADEVARRYREVYGYGRAFRALFVGVAALLGVASLPVVVGGPELSPTPLVSGAVLAALVAFLLWVSVAAGARTGFASGAAAAVARVAGFFVLNLAYGFFDPRGVGLLVIVSALLPVLGWLPGGTRRAWKKPGAAL